MSWKDDVLKREDDKYRKKKEDEERELSERKRKIQEDYDREHPSSENLKNFRCHICGVEAKEPGMTCDYTSPGPTGDTSSYISEPQWYSTNKWPGDLHRCDWCGEWACKTHYLNVMGKMMSRHLIWV
ncbi:MAG: hypothetical protein L6461_07395 [Anaerolineae bacterium]|nr:hypothetical protein [Anaerolineae bacterium]